ncbi:SH3 domain-containing protein [Planctomycetota bacterium]|nr:SH3 domain-containing protein [Planctomycetota bacterium]
MSSTPKLVIPMLALAALLLQAQPASAETVEVTARALNVRSGPSTSRARVATVYRGQRYQALSRSGGWVKLRVSGREGWSHGGFLRTVSTPAAPAPAPSQTTLAVSASTLNVRSGPGTRFRRIGRLTRGARVRVTGSSGRWRRFTFQGRTAWVHGDFLTSGSTPPPTPPSQPANATAWDRTPPAANYGRTTFRGRRVNRRTAELIQRAERIMGDLGRPGFRFVLTQGSYSTSVAASGGTHGGGGAVDIRTRGHSRGTVDAMVRALRRAGFAAWSRGRGADSFAPHIHAIAIGDRDLSSSARNQVRAYAQGRNGLRNRARDADGALGREVPSWARPLLNP